MTWWSRHSHGPTGPTGYPDRRRACSLWQIHGESCEDWPVQSARLASQPFEQPIHPTVPIPAGIQETARMLEVPISRGQRPVAPGVLPPRPGSTPTGLGAEDCQTRHFVLQLSYIEQGVLVGTRMASSVRPRPRQGRRNGGAIQSHSRL